MNSHNKTQKRTPDLEFGGKIGTAAMVIGLPFTVYGLNFACSETECTVTKLPKIPQRLSAYFDSTAALIFLGWMAFQLILSLLPIGRICKGQMTRTGTRLKYRCNGFHALMISIVMLLTLYNFGIDVTIVYTKMTALITTAVIFSCVLSILLYVHSYMVPKSELAEGGNTGHMLYDFFIGRELNPRIGPCDLKFFCEMRPGLIGWVILDFCFMIRAHETMEKIPITLMAVSAFHFLYVADALFYEESILSTMDIVHDGFGFMLTFGDLVWVPFTYTLQAKYLLQHPQELSWVILTGITVLKLVGYSIFRDSNSEKDEFRRNPNSSRFDDVQTIHTASGKKLMVSGVWGMCRHPNYLGDCLMALSWSLLTGVNALLPYYYPIYLTGLLTHRSLRDDANCRKKYGLDWNIYCKKVPYVMCPYIY